jgi:hypothetical protein
MESDNLLERGRHQFFGLLGATDAMSKVANG